MWPRNFVHITMALKGKCVFKKWAWNRTYIHYCWYFACGRDRLWCVSDAMLWLCFTTSICVRIIWWIGCACDIFTWNVTETMPKLWWRRVRISAHAQTSTGVKSVKHINLTIGEPHTHTHTHAVPPKICRTLKTDAKLDRQRGMEKRERERATATDSPNHEAWNQGHNYTHSASSTIKAAKLT